MPQQDTSQPAYVVIHMNVVDQEGFRRYLSVIGPILAKFDGSFVFQLRPAEQLIDAPFSQGLDAWATDPKAYLVVIRFEDRAQIKAWFESEEYNSGPKALLKSSTMVDLRVFDLAHPIG